MTERIEEVEFEISGLRHLVSGFSIMASSAKKLGEIVWYESQLRNYNYLLKKAKGRLEKELLSDDFNAS